MAAMIWTIKDFFNRYRTILTLESFPLTDYEKAHTVSKGLDNSLFFNCKIAERTAKT